MHKILLVLAALILSIMTAAPALAAPADIELLHGYAGSWRGAGELTGPDSGQVRCRLTMRPSGAKLSFSGRCTLAGSGTRRFDGVLAYNEASGRFESSSSQGTFQGRKSRGGIVFSMQDSTPQGDVTSTMSLTGGKINVDFELTDRDGAVSGSRITFTRS